MKKTEQVAQDQGQNGFVKGYNSFKRVVGIIDDKIHAGETYHFMQLVSAFIDVSPFGHKCSDFSAFFLNCLRQISAHKGHFGF